MLADILTAKTDLADLAFLVALILALVAAVLVAVDPPHRMAGVLAYAALAAIGLGLLAL